ncbi:MAG: hypothetical protein JOZ36_08880 [Acidobacteria bacterium]|nr:hypothetical protein [Acidobacteriota bacterium]
MELGAIIIIGRNLGKATSAGPPYKAPFNSSCQKPMVCWDLLGASPLRRMVAQLRESGVQLISALDSVAPEHKTGAQSWEQAVLDYARGGVEEILLLDLRAYTEMNLYELVSFHRDNSSPVTNVADDRGLLGITLLRASAIDQDDNLSRRLQALSSCSSTFEFSGFVHRLVSPADYRELVQSALSGACNIKPIAREIQPGVWMGEGARVASSVRVLGPCFLGAKTRVKAGSVIRSGSAIERECEIDCGTVVEAASILPRTYVAPGLRVSNAVVDGGRFVHLGRKLEVELADTGLVGSTGKRASRRILDSLGSVFALGGSGLDLPTPSRAPASLDYVRGNGFME